MGEEFVEDRPTTVSRWAPSPGVRAQRPDQGGPDVAGSASGAAVTVAAEVTVVAPPLLRQDEAEALGERIQQQAAILAEATCELLLLVGEFEARGGVGWFVGLASTAHWLSWACSLAPGTAREHVRVARALGSMPRTVAEFRAGRLSYSKVREITRVVDRVDEEALVELARSLTASQLARTVSAFRAAEGSRLGQEPLREARWQVREDGMVEVRALLPAEEGAQLVTALDLAVDRDGTPPPTVEDQRSSAGIGDDQRLREEESAATTTRATIGQRRADALVELAASYLSTEPDDRSGEDRHLVVIQVSADSLPRDVPAGTSGRGDAAARGVPVGTPDPPADVPAGTSGRCGVLGLGPIEPRTAERLACTGKVALEITDANGEVLHLGRSQRLASRAQRRALRLRDGTCVFPGCQQDRHLDAHHLVPWSEGGPTDIEGLALLCRRHHVIVHEGGFRLVVEPSAVPGAPRHRVIDAAGRGVEVRWPPMLEHVRSRAVDTSAQGRTNGGDPDPTRIAATTGGEGFRLADCVDALFFHAA